jgi:tetratricopeptide (TPR) repeat protein
MVKRFAKTSTLSRVFRLASVLSLVVALDFQAIPALALTQDALYYYKQGFAAEKAGQQTQAYAQYKKALELDPTDGTLYLVMGQMLEKSSQRTEATDVYKAGLAHNPNDIMLNAAMARLMETSGQASNAAQYTKVLANSRFDFPYVFFVNADAPKPVTVTSLSGQSFVLNQTPGYTRSGYNTFMERPQVAQLYEYLGNMYGRMGRLPDAYNAYQMAVKVDPQGNPQVYPKMAAIAQAQGDSAGVVRAQNNALAYQLLSEKEAQRQATVATLPMTTKSVSAKVVTDTPTVYLSASKPSTAGQSKPQIIASTSSSQTSTPGTAFLVTQTPAKSIEQVLATQGGQTTVMTSSISTPHTIVPSEFLPYIKLQRYEEAQYGALRALILAHPENLEARMTMASMDLDRSRIDEAMVNLNELLRRDPNNVMALWMRAKTWVGIGRYDDGLRDMETAYRLQPNNMSLLEDLAATLRRVGYWNRADQVLYSAGVTPTYVGTSPILGGPQYTPQIYVPPATASVSARVVETPGTAYSLLIPSDLAAKSNALNAASQSRMPWPARQYRNVTPGGLSYPVAAPAREPQMWQQRVIVQPNGSSTYYVMP